MRILLVEDQPLIGKAIKLGLSEEGFAVDWVTNIEDGLHLARELEFDSVVLDLMLPDGSGLDLLRELRTKDNMTPVLILTAKDTIQDKIDGFARGTDDYLTKPFVFEELLGRVRALTRRRYQFHGNKIDLGALRIDLIGRTAHTNGKDIGLTSKEFSILELLLLNRSKILSRIKLTEHLYSEDTEIAASNVIDVFINKLRRKLEAAKAGFKVETVRGEGYVIR
jgi:two-component system response regulator PhoP